MKLLAAERRTCNDKLHDLCTRRHPHIPNQSIAQILALVGMRMEEALFCGREGKAHMELYKGEENVSNSWLVLHWCKGEVTPDYEITAYLS